MRDCMEIQRISAMVKTQAAYGRHDQSCEETDNHSGGWKYLTVHEGGRTYTYLVIGKNMKILIGETAEKKTNDKDKKTAEAKGNVNGEAKQENAAGANDVSGSTDVPINGQGGREEKRELKNDFFTDTAMFAFTGYYQKKMRETVKKLEKTIGNDSPRDTIANVEETAKD